MSKKVFYVFQDWVAIELANMGFTYITREDLKDKTKIVYIFSDGEEAEKAFKQMRDKESGSLNK